MRYLLGPSVTLYASDPFCSEHDLRRDLKADGVGHSQQTWWIDSILKLGCSNAQAAKDRTPDRGFLSIALREQRPFM